MLSLLPSELFHFILEEVRSYYQDEILKGVLMRFNKAGSGIFIAP